MIDGEKLATGFDGATEVTLDGKMNYFSVLFGRGKKIPIAFRRFDGNVYMKGNSIPCTQLLPHRICASLSPTIASIVRFSLITKRVSINYYALWVVAPYIVYLLSTVTESTSLITQKV